MILLSLRFVSFWRESSKEVDDGLDLPHDHIILITRARSDHKMKSGLPPTFLMTSSSKDDFQMKLYLIGLCQTDVIGAVGVAPRANS